MQHELDLVLRQSVRVDHRPGGIQNIAQHSGIPQALPQRVGNVRRGWIEAAQQDAEALGLCNRATGRVHRLEVIKRIDHLHGARHHGVVLHALVVVVDLLEQGMNIESQRLGLFAKLQAFEVFRPSHCCCQAARMRGCEFAAKVPDPFQETVRALHRSIVPLQRGLGWGGEHGVQARGVGAVFFDQVLRVHTVVLALAHGADPLIGDQRAGWQFALGCLEPGARHLARVVVLVFHLVRPKVLYAALVALA